MNAILCCCEEKQLPHVRRELFRNEVHVEAEFSTVSDAVRATDPTTEDQRLMVMQLGGPDGFDSLRHLQSAFPRWPIVALVERGPNIEEFNDLVLRAMRSGADQIVHLPPEPQDFAEMLQQIAIRHVYTASTTRAIAVAGTTGGCGVTTLAVNLAYELSHRWGKRCILVDLSLKMGMVASHLDLNPRYTILDLLKDSSRIDSTLLRVVLERFGDNLHVLAGPHEAIAPAATRFSAVRPVLQAARQMCHVLVLDVPSTYDDLYFETLGYADHVVLVGEQKLPSIRAMVMVREAIGRTDSPRDLKLVINRYDPKLKGFTSDCLLKPLGAARLHTIASDWHAVSTAANHGRPLRLERPDSPALSDINALAESLVGRPPEDSRRNVRSPGLLNRLGRALIG